MTQLFRIKPLEWEWFETEWQRGWRTVGGLFWASVHQWRVLKSDDFSEKWAIAESKSNYYDYASHEEGKQLAEAHWRTYIAQALIPVETSE